MVDQAGAVRRPSTDGGVQQAINGPRRSTTGSLRRYLRRWGTLAIALWLVAAPVHAAEPVTSWHVPVLMYHRVAPDHDLRDSILGLVVRPTTFAAHMRALHDAGWRTITARQLAAAMRARVAVPSRTVVITFDDGTQDVYTHAWPILQRFGYVGTFYLITGRTPERTRSWSYYMSRDQARELAAGGNEIANHTRDHACLSSTGYRCDHYEIDGGARDIKGFIGLRPTTLAWPKGCYSATAIRAAKDASMFLAFTTQPGCHEALATRLTTPRIRVSRGTTPAGLLRLIAPCRSSGRRRESNATSPARRSLRRGLVVACVP
jgi:hypothetical protein